MAKHLKESIIKKVEKTNASFSNLRDFQEDVHDLLQSFYDSDSPNPEVYSHKVRKSGTNGRRDKQTNLQLYPSFTRAMTSQDC